VPAAAVVLLATRTWRATLPAGSFPVPALVPALVVAAGPTLLLALAGERPGLRAGVVLVSVAVLAVIAAQRPGRATTHTALGLSVGAGLVGLIRADSPYLADDLVVEAWTVPVALALLGVGATAVARDRAAGSWRALGGGLAVLLAPSLALSLTAGPGGAGWRAAGLLGLGTVVVLAGVARRLQAPVVLGAVTLGVHAAHLLGPTLLGWYSAAPQWVTLGLAGSTLLALGVRYERRLADVRSAGARLAALR
jgi:hypothetical protein